MLIHGGHAGLDVKHLLNLVSIDSDKARRKAKRLAKGLTHVALPLSYLVVVESI